MGYEIEGGRFGLFRFGSVEGFAQDLCFRHMAFARDTLQPRELLIADFDRDGWHEPKVTRSWQTDNPDFSTVANTGPILVYQLDGISLSAVSIGTKRPTPSDHIDNYTKPVQTRFVISFKKWHS
jgi:hypothetical protein